MKSNKEYRFNYNPKEKEFHDKFFQMFNANSRSITTLSGIVFGWQDGTCSIPKEYLDEKGEEICLNIIQWLGSNVGQNFLLDCGFERKQ